MYDFFIFLVTKYGIFVCEGPCRINFGCQNSQTNHFCMGDNSKFLFSNIVFHTVATQKKFYGCWGLFAYFITRKDYFWPIWFVYSLVLLVGGRDIPCSWNFGRRGLLIRTPVIVLEPSNTYQNNALNLLS